MVQCDSCDGWYHYIYMNVTNLDWECDDCIREKELEKELETNK